MARVPASEARRLRAMMNGTEELAIWKFVREGVPVNGVAGRVWGNRANRRLPQ